MAVSTGTHNWSRFNIAVVYGDNELKITRDNSSDTLNREHRMPCDRFDVLVNGGGAVTLQFQRANFLPLTITVPAPWNDIVVLDPVKLTLKSEATKDVSVLGEYSAKGRN